MDADLKLAYKKIGSDIEIRVPSLTVDEMPCQYAYTFKISSQ